MKVSYPSGGKTITIITWTKENVKCIARKSYSSLSSSLVSSTRTAAVARCIKKEMKVIISTNHDSIIRDTYEAVKHFSWNFLITCHH